jgi:hypothetical protein
VDATPPGEYPPPEQWQLPSYPVAQPSRYTYAPPTPRGRDALIGLLVVVLIVVAAVIEVSNSARLSGTSPSAAQPGSAPQNPVFPVVPLLPPSSAAPSSAAPSAAAGVGVTASSVLSATGGVKVFSDDFADPASGWLEETRSYGSYGYTPHGYAISSHVSAHLLTFAPYYVAAPQITLSVTAAESVGAPLTGGFGLYCSRGANSGSKLRYEFVVNESGRWFIERNQGALTSTAGAPATILRQGTLPRLLGSQPMTLSGVCATLADGQTTRLALFVGSTQVADTADVATLDGHGWLGGLLSSGGAGVSSTTTVSQYNEYSLGAAVAGGSVPDGNVPDGSVPVFGVNA